jgi:hypothetical protein
MPTQTINLNNTTPVAPAGAQNIEWQADPASLDPTVARNVSAYFSAFTGDTGAGGKMGFVPAPAAGDAAAGKVLKADGTWYVPPAAGMANPMTTRGDLIVGGAAGAPTRLAAGTAGMVLQTNGPSAAPGWVSPSGGSGGSVGNSLTNLEINGAPIGLNGVGVISIPEGTPPSSSPGGCVQIYVRNAVGANIVPRMVGYAEPSGVVSASSEYRNEPNVIAAYRAFDNQAPSEGWLTAQIPTGWLQYQFANVVTLLGYAITPWSVDTFPYRSPTAWTFLGSDDGTTWVTLDTQSVTPASWVISTPRTFLLSSPASYQYFRLNITANDGDGYAGVRLLQLLATRAGLFVLLENGVEAQLA